MCVEISIPFMRIWRIRYTLLVAILIFGLVNAPTSAFAAVKSGSACKVLGQISVQGSTSFQCTKSGKKLIWAVKPEVKPIQTALGSPIAMKAFAEMQKAIAAMGTSAAPKITTIPSPSTDSKLEKEIQGNLLFASEYFKNYLPQSQPISVWIIGSPLDLKWNATSWRIAIPYQAENLITRSDAFSAEVGYATDGALAMVITSPDQLTTFHEFTHAVQDMLAQGKAGLPCWVREGMAEYESNAMMGRNSEVAYKAAMLNLIDELSMISFSLFKYRSAGLDYWVNYFANDETRNNGECRKNSSALDAAYSVGGLGFQYLQGQYGRDKVFEFIKNIGQDWKGVCPSANDKMIACKSWKISFKKSFGVEPAVAYKAMGAFIVNQIEWSTTVKSMSESDIIAQFPESRSIPKYEPLAKVEVAGAPCLTNGETAGSLKCVNKDNFFFWSASGNGGGQNNSGSKTPVQIDDLGAPAGVPAPGRTCPNVGDKARYEKTPLMCVKGSGNTGTWMIDNNPAN